MPIGRLITQLRKSIASGHPDLFQEIFGEDPAPVIKRYLNKFADTNLIKLLHEFEEGRKVYSGTDYADRDNETVFFVNGILGHSDLLQEQLDDLSHLLERPVVGITSAHDSALLDVATTLFGYLTFTHIMNWIVKEKLVAALGENRKVILLAFGHGAVIAQHAIDLLEEEGNVNAGVLAENLRLVTFGGSVSAQPKGDAVMSREHFANEHDAAAKRGCLSWAQDEETQKRCGRVFVGKGCYGHMLREHYLIPLSTKGETFEGAGESQFVKDLTGRLPL